MDKPLTPPVTTKVRSARKSLPKLTAKRRIRKETASIYLPTYDQLEANFDVEFGKWLKSLYETIDNYRKAKDAVILPLEKELKKTEKRLTTMNLHLKSLRHWKIFYTDYIKWSDEILAMFSLTELRDPDDVVQSLPDTLRHFVHDSLRTWRETHWNKPWHVEYRKAVKELDETNRRIEEESRKAEIIEFILKACEDNGISANELENAEPENIVDWFEKKLQSLRSENENTLKLLPSVTRKERVRLWCSKYYKQEIPSSKDASSDNQTASDELWSMDGDDQVTSSSDVSSLNSDVRQAEEALDLNDFFDD